jgi:AcrR family transcriptional regulator
MASPPLETPSKAESPRAARRSETQTRILAAARDILVERTTVDALSLREVARRSGFTPGALYRYFDDRDALVQALYGGALQVLGSYLGRAQGATAAERLVALADAYLRFGRDRPQDLLLLFESSVPPHPWADYVKIAWPFTLIVEGVQNGIDEGELTPLAGLDAAGTAYVFWAQVHGFAVLHVGHLANVTGKFGAMQDAAIADFVARLRRPEGSAS